jgi:DNA-binding transcriptional ArsR family regulator
MTPSANPKPAAPATGWFMRAAAGAVDASPSLMALGIHNRRVMILTMQAVADDLFKAIAGLTRRAIFERLARDGEQTVHALTDRAGVSQPAVSKHLGVLKLAKLVRDRREGRETRYSVQPQALAPLINWMSLYGAFWRDRFDRLETLLKRMDQRPNPPPRAPSSSNGRCRIRRKESGAPSLKAR